MATDTPMIVMPAELKAKLDPPKTVLVYGNDKCHQCKGGGIHRTMKTQKGVTGISLSVCPNACDYGTKQPATTGS